MQIANRLHSDDASLLGRTEHLLSLALVRREGLLDQHVFAAKDRRERLRRMGGVGRGDIDGIDGVARAELGYAPEGKLRPVRIGELAGPRCVSGTASDEFGPLDVGKSGDELLADAAGADGCEAHLAHICPPRGSH